MTNLIQANLVLEGGALRGIFTAGLLDALDEQNLMFEFVIGVSAGACMGASYVSRQKGRSKKITIGYCQDKRYFSWRNLLREGNLFGVKFTYERIPHELVPFDYQTFYNSKIRFIAVTTDIQTGKPVYLQNNTEQNKTDFTTPIRASASMPFLSKPVPFNGQLLLDGGVADSIPIEYSVKNGHKKSVVILTRPRGYIKKPAASLWLFKIFLRRWPKLAEAMYYRFAVYNREIAEVEKQKSEGKCLVVYPPPDIKIGRLERDKQKLETMYQVGYQAGLDLAKKLPEFLAQ